MSPHDITVAFLDLIILIYMVITFVFARKLRRCAAVIREARYVVKAERRHNELLGQYDNELSEEETKILQDAIHDAEEEMIVSIVRLSRALYDLDGTKPRMPLDTN